MAKIDPATIYEVDPSDPAPDPSTPRPGVLTDEDALAIMKKRREGKPRAKAIEEGHRRVEQRAVEDEETERRTFDSIDEAYEHRHADEPVETKQLTPEQQAAADAKRAQSAALQREAAEGEADDIPVTERGEPAWTESDRTQLAQLRQDATVFHQKMTALQQAAAQIQQAGSIEALVNGDAGAAQAIKLQLAALAQELQREKVRLTEAGQRVQDITQRAQLAHARKELYRREPALRDPHNRAALRSWLVNDRGYSDADVSAVTDPSLVVLAWDAYRAAHPKLTKGEARGKLKQAAERLRLQQAPPRQQRDANGRYQPVEAARKRAAINRKDAPAKDITNERYWARTGISPREAARGGSLTGALRLLEKRRNQGRTRPKS